MVLPGTTACHPCIGNTCQLSGLTVTLLTSNAGANVRRRQVTVPESREAMVSDALRADVARRFGPHQSTGIRVFGRCFSQCADRLR